MKFAAELVADIAVLPAKYNRGVKANLAILENWLRAALLTLAETVDLPTPRRLRRAESTIAEPNTSEKKTSERRRGFRCIQPDEQERELAAENRFDISQFSGGASKDISHDPRPAYRARLAAIEAVLEAPETYARRVKRKINERKNRVRIKRVKLPHHSPLEDLARTSPYSDLGRYIWYNDSS